MRFVFNLIVRLKVVIMGLGLMEMQEALGASTLASWLQSLGK